MARAVLTFFLIFLISECSFAQSNSSGVFRFLDITLTARTAALGGNHTGLFNGDFSLIHINPAYLHREASGSVSASYMNFLGGANMGFTNSAYHVKDIGTFAAGIRFMGYGEFDRLDENGNQMGNFRANDVALTGAYSIPITANIRAGAGLDLIHSSYAEFRSTALSVSGGLYYQDTPGHFSAGIALRNAGAQLTTFDDRREPLPMDLSVGITKKPEAFPFQLSLTLTKLTNWDLRTVGESNRPALIDNAFRHVVFGGEAYLGENATFRLGYDHYLHEQLKTGGNFDLAGISIGVGFTIKNITLDFSRNSYSKLGGLTRLSLKTKLF